MAAGDITPGRRLDWFESAPVELAPGDYMYHRHNDGTIGVWVRLPAPAGGHGPVCLSTWSPVIEDDGTLTLSPSILAHQKKLGPHNKIMPGVSITIPEWHGYLERGQWREV